MTYRLIEFLSFFLFSGNLIFCYIILSVILLLMSDEGGLGRTFTFRLEIQFVANKSQLDVSSKSGKLLFSCLIHKFVINDVNN